MPDQSCTVGESLSRAMARADELAQSSPRRVRVRIVTRHGDLDPGIIIVASIAAKTGPELEAQMGKGVRYIPLAELDARSHELPAMVDEAAEEIEAAVAAAPPPPQRPSRRENDFDIGAYEDLIESSYRAMLDSTGALAAAPVASLSASAVAEALAAGALKVAALSAIAGRIELHDLGDMLKDEYRNARERSRQPGGAHQLLH